MIQQQQRQRHDAHREACQQDHASSPPHFHFKERKEVTTSQRKYGIRLVSLSNHEPGVVWKAHVVRGASYDKILSSHREERTNIHDRSLSMMRLYGSRFTLLLASLSHVHEKMVSLRGVKHHAPNLWHWTPGHLYGLRSLLCPCYTMSLQREALS